MTVTVTVSGAQTGALLLLLWIGPASEDEVDGYGASEVGGYGMPPVPLLPAGAVPVPIIPVPYENDGAGSEEEPTGLTRVELSSAGADEGPLSAGGSWPP